MNHIISGYLIVRKVECPKAFKKEYPATVSGIRYQGFERDSFYDLSNLHLEGRLQEPFLEYYLSARANDDGYIGEYTKDYFIGLKMLDFSNKVSGSSNEIIAFTMDDKNKFTHDGQLKLLGLDILFNVGSLLYQGIFSKPNLFKNYINELTISGLFPDENKIIQNYINDYREFSRDTKNHLEPLEDGDIRSVIKIWKISALS